ncbi:MAG: carbonic anhydrase family protein [Akkermansiaceae bacterium]|nr:carbonic anhydrase family protein [Akkermansiaceae bacterium]
MTPFNSFLACIALAPAMCLPLHAENLQPSAEEQQAMTPDAVLKDLMDGNARYVAGKIADPNLAARIAMGAEGQNPKAYILSCVDSRVPVEQVFDEGIGDIFVGRVAGNIEDVSQLGSMEFATAAAGAKLVMVLGHEACGAVKGACDHVELGNLTALLDEIEPAVDAVEGFEDDQKNSKNKEFVDAVIDKNVRITVANIRERSEVLANLEKEGKIKIVGALCSLQDGKVTLIEE